MSNTVSIPKHSPWMSQYLVIVALMRREVTTKFGQYQLGFFWMLFEPLLGTIVIGLIVGGFVQRTVPEIPYVFFLLHGFMLLQLFTGVMGVGVRTVGANNGLLVYPAVKPMDLFVARFLFELCTTLFSMVLFTIISMFLGVQLYLGDLQILIACYLLTWLTGSGFGLILGVAAAHYKEVEKVVPILQRPLLFISGVFFSLATIPESIRKYLVYNPLVHTIEIGRHSLFPNYRIVDVNLSYPAIVAIVVVALGLVFYQNNRNFLASR